MKYGLVLVLGTALSAAAGHGQGTSVAQAVAPEAHGTLAWFAGSQEELAAAAKHEQRPTMIYLWTKGERWCQRLETQSLREDALSKALGGLLLWNTDAEVGSGAILSARFSLTAFPVLLFFDASGAPVERIDGFLSKEALGLEVARVLRQEDTLPGLRRRVALDPADVQLRSRLVDKLWALGGSAEAEEQLEDLRRRDPKRTCPVLRREVLAERMALIEEHFSRTRVLNPGPLVRFLEEERNVELLFLGYASLASLHLRRAEELESVKQPEAARSKRADVRAALTNAASYAPVNAALRLGFALRLFSSFAAHPAELSEPDRALLLQLSAEAVSLAPDEARVHACAALASFFTGDQASASAAARRALELEPGHPEWLSIAQTVGL